MKLTTLCAVSALLTSSAALAGGMGHVPVTPIGGDPYGPGGMIGQHPRDHLPHVVLARRADDDRGLARKFGHAAASLAKRAVATPSGP